MNEIVSKKYRNIAPQSLFHYTKLSVLELILANKTLRLTPLTELDDPEESRTAEGSGWPQYTFVSCWVGSKVESIPMWSMYAGLEEGVRIEMEIDPFRRYEYSKDEIERMLQSCPLQVRMEIPTFRTFLPMDDMKTAFSPSFLSGEEILTKVSYGDDESKLNPELYSESSKSAALVSFNDLGTQKDSHWGFQDEWRYILRFFPINIYAGPESAYENLKVNSERVKINNLPAPFEYYDLHLRDDAIAHMKFRFSPKMNLEKRARAIKLLDSFGLKGQIEESELIGKV